MKLWTKLMRANFSIKSLYFLALTFIPVFANAQINTVLTDNLKNYSVSGGSGYSILAIGYYAAGDMPPVLYTLQNSVCSLNSGNGDGGAQIKSMSSGSWCWILGAQTTYDVRTWGAVADPSDPNSNNAQLINNAISYMADVENVFSHVNMPDLTGGGLIYGLGNLCISF